MRRERGRWRAMPRLARGCVLVRVSLAAACGSAGDDAITTEPSAASALEAAIVDSDFATPPAIAASCRSFGLSADAVGGQRMRTPKTAVELPARTALYDCDIEVSEGEVVECFTLADGTPILVDGTADGSCRSKGIAVDG
jgi:hypothetical protein